MKIERCLERPDIFEYKVIGTGEIPFSPAVREACRSNTCGRYGKNWMCPPGVGDMEKWEQTIKAYSRAAVFTCKYGLEDSFDFEGMQEGQRQAKQVFTSVADALRRSGERFLMLGSGDCDLCESCAYPEPCRYPDRASPSVEACGVNVMQMAKQIGVRYNNGPNTVTYFCVVLFDE